MKKLLIPLLCLLTLTSISTKADVASDVKDMLSTLTERAGGSLTFTSPASATPETVLGMNRHALDFGGMRLRSPIKNVNIMSFTPPSFSAGCSGVDLVLGSFSFLSKDELLGLLRSIASNSLMFGFGQAIKNMAPDVWASIASLQEKIQNLNQMFSNSCTVAKCVNTDGCFADQLGDVGCMFTSGWTQDSDFSECKSDQRKSGEKAKQASNIKNNTTGTEKTPFLYGNQTIEALDELGLNDLENTLSDLKNILNIAVPAQELILSITGSYIVQEDKQISVFNEPTVDIDSLLFPTYEGAGAGNIELYQCGGDETANGITYECLTLSKQTLSADATNLHVLVKDAIIGLHTKIDNMTLNTLTSLELYILNFVDRGVREAIVVGTPQDKELAKAYLEQMGLYLAHSMAASLSSNLRKFTKKLIDDGKTNELFNDAEGHYQKVIDKLIVSELKHKDYEKKYESKLRENTVFNLLKKKFATDLRKTLQQLSTNR